MSTHNFPKSIPTIPSRGEFRVFIDDEQAVSNLAELLDALLSEQNPLRNRQIVLLAIGTDRSTGDSLGPLVGSRVTQLAPGLIPVYGTLDEPVHAVNLKEKVQQINKKYSFPLIIAVDACLGQLQSVGSITLGKGSLYPGTGVHKKTASSRGDLHLRSGKYRGLPGAPGAAEHPPQCGHEDGRMHLPGTGGCGAAAGVLFPIGKMP